MIDAKKFYNLDSLSQTQKIYAEKVLLNVLDKLKYKKLLEVGCGDGHLLTKLPKGKCFGLESSQDMINNKVNSEIEMIMGDILDKDFALKHNGQFNVAIANYVFMQFNQKELEMAFSNVHNLLSNGGKIIFTITDPRTRDRMEFDGYKLEFTEPFEYSKQDLLFKVLLYDGKKYVDVGIRDFHNPVEIYENLLNKTKFENIKIEDIKRNKDDYTFALLISATKN